MGKKRAELGMDVVKKEEVEDVKEVVTAKSVIEEDGNSISEPAVCSSTVPVTVTETDTTANTEATGNPTINTGRKDNKDAVRKEIEEIEDQLARRRKKNKEGDIEDGECIDSEEDFEKSSSATSVENLA